MVGFSNMHIVVDVELFANNVIKEIGFATPFYSVGFGLKPPYPESMFTGGEKRHNLWLTANMHDIAWNSGFWFYTELKQLISYLKVKGDVTYYAKGSQKCHLLTALFGFPFLNLDDIGCPSIVQLPLETIPCQAFPHIHSESRVMHCAQKKANAYSTWFTGYNMIEGLENIELSFGVDENDDSGFDV